MDHAELEKRIRERIVGDPAAPRLSCGEAHRLAAELGVEVRQIGEICQHVKIKIIHCELGCFGEQKHEK